MKFLAIFITNNATAYGGVKPLRQVALFVFIPDCMATYDANGYVTGVN